MANRLQRCANAQETGFTDDRNEYAAEFDFIIQNKRVDTENGTYIRELTPYEEAVKEKYYAREKEIQRADIDYDKETFKWLAEDIYRMWD